MLPRIDPTSRNTRASPVTNVIEWHPRSPTHATIRRAARYKAGAWNPPATRHPAAFGVSLQGFLQRVFAWMFAGLLLTGRGRRADRLQRLADDRRSPRTRSSSSASSGPARAGDSRWWRGINHMSPATALGLFFVYAATVGVTFAMIFELYTTQSIFTTFLVTGGDVRLAGDDRRHDQGAT